MLLTAPDSVKIFIMFLLLRASTSLMIANLCANRFLWHTSAAHHG